MQGLISHVGRRGPQIYPVLGVLTDAAVDSLVICTLAVSFTAASSVSITA